MKTLKSMTLTAGAAALAAIAMTGCGVEFNPGTHRETKAYEIAGDYPSFTIRGDSSRLEVVGTDGPQIRVQEFLRWSNSKNKPQTKRDVRNGTLSLDSHCAQSVIGWNACGVNYRVEVPRKTNVTLQAGSGKVEVSGLSGDSLTLTSDSGSIEAREIHTKALTATSESGKISMDGHADTARLRAESGKISASDLHTRTALVRATSGKVELGLGSVPDNVDVRLDSGKVELSLPVDDQGYAIDLNSDSGGQNIAPEIRQNSASPHRVTVHSDSGAIDIDAAGPNPA